MFALSAPRDAAGLSFSSLGAKSCDKQPTIAAFVLPDRISGSVAGTVTSKDAVECVCQFVHASQDLWEAHRRDRHTRRGALGQRSDSSDRRGHNTHLELPPAASNQSVGPIERANFEVASYVTIR